MRWVVISIRKHFHRPLRSLNVLSIFSGQLRLHKQNDCLTVIVFYSVRQLPDKDVSMSEIAGRLPLMLAFEVIKHWACWSGLLHTYQRLAASTVYSHKKAHIFT
jgi:hypothetical protein